MERYGVIGKPIDHSLSPLLHRCLYEQTGHRAEYSRFEVEPARIAEVVPAMRALGIRGINVTSPHKVAILPCMDELDPVAKAVGAVNTVLLREDGTACGYNTDVFGFTRSMAHLGIPIGGRRFVLCGMSGGGAAVREALAREGAAEVLTASTNPAKGIAYESLRAAPPRDVIVNCTPLGMWPDVDRSVVDEAVLKRFHAAVDLIYSPTETLFLRKAAALGRATLNGLWMLVFQGIRSFSIWTGIPESAVDAEKIYRRLEVALSDERQQ